MDLKTLLTAAANTAEFEIPGKGTVTLRGLTRHEVTLAGDLTDDKAAMERFLLVCGLVEPKITEEDAITWTKVATFGEINSIVTKINELSGFGPGADKS